MTIDTLSLLPAPAAAPVAPPVPGRPAVRSTRGGPGWFDSSFELDRGLDVREGWPGDARLRSWIESFLGAQPLPGGESLSVT